MIPTLSAYHNISEEKLINALEIGGFALPSLAVTRTDFSFHTYGKITLIAPMHLVDPAHAKVELYSRDAYTGRTPERIYKRLTSKKKDDLINQFRDILEFVGPSELSSFDYQLNTEPPHLFFRSFLSNYAVKLAYIQNVTGKPLLDLLPQKNSSPDAAYDIISSYSNLVPSTSYSLWARKVFETFAGEPLLEYGRRKVPYNLENITAVMKKNRGKGKEETCGFGSGKVAAFLTKKYTSLQSVWKDRKFLACKEDVDKAIEENSSLVLKFQTDTIPFYEIKDYNGKVKVLDARDSSMKALSLIGSLKKDPTREEIQSALKRNYFSEVPSEILDSGLRAWKSIRDTPTQYFEAKIQRAVTLDEFSAIIVPKNICKELADMLKKSPIPVITYDPRDENSRDKAVCIVHKKLPCTCLSGKGYSNTSTTAIPKVPTNHTR